MTILLIGATGSGKTWVMKQLIGDSVSQFSMGQVKGVEKDKTIFLGVYDGSTFEGSDKLSMSVARDFDLLKGIQDSIGYNIVCEGDRFMNKRFIDTLSPTIIKIKGDGSVGRQKRRSNQSDRQIQSIQTRVNNIKADIEVSSSLEALSVIKKLLQKTMDKPQIKE